MIRFSRKALLGLICLLSLAATPSLAADYPNRPIRWLIGFAAGGPVDTVARTPEGWRLSTRRLHLADIDDALVNVPADRRPLIEQGPHRTLFQLHEA